jgi:Bacterial regulatory proteins, gntR family
MRSKSAKSTQVSASAADRGPGGGPTKKLAEQTSEKIEMRIIEMDWPVGKVIGSEADLLAEYNVSCAALREAIRLLEGLLQNRSSVSHREIWSDPAWTRACRFAQSACWPCGLHLDI